MSLTQFFDALPRAGLPLIVQQQLTNQLTNHARAACCARADYVHYVLIMISCVGVLLLFEPMRY